MELIDIDDEEINRIKDSDLLYTTLYITIYCTLRLYTVIYFISDFCLNRRL